MLDAGHWMLVRLASSIQHPVSSEVYETDCQYFIALSYPELTFSYFSYSPFQKLKIARMKTSHCILCFILMTSLTLVSNCSKNGDDVPNPITDCWSKPSNDIQFTKLSETEVTLPSKISIFFKLDDRDGEPVANLTEADFNIYEQGLNDDCLYLVSEFEAERKISEREQRFSYSTVLLLDLSGSVVDNFLPDLKASAKRFVRTISGERPDNEGRIGIWWFDGGENIHQLVAVTSDTTKLLQGIDNISENISTDNSTNLFGAVSQIAPVAEGILNDQLQKDIISGASVVLFTDGRDRANRVPRQTAYDAVDNTDPAVTYFTIGLGGEINQNDLQRIGKDGFAAVSNIEQLEATFQNVAQLVNDEANSYYFFEYCSPIRSGASNNLVIEAVYQSKKGFLESTFDATGFSGDCNLE
jgi:hypothetical protein